MKTQKVTRKNVKKTFYTYDLKLTVSIKGLVLLGLQKTLGG